MQKLSMNFLQSYISYKFTYLISNLVLVYLKYLFFILSQIIIIWISVY